MKILLFSIDQDLAGGGPFQAVEDLHEGAFASTVFADDGQDLALFQGEGHIIVGEQITVLFGNATHFYECHK